ncbi:MAG: PilN domain-containing protein [Hyphomicrobiales bacterium]|nr:PilN domain-containing protein [Hyphomicrobiales bacterium]
MPIDLTKIPRAASRAGRWWLHEFRLLFPGPASQPATQTARLILQAQADAVAAVLKDRRDNVLFEERVPWSAFSRSTLELWMRKAAARERSFEVAVAAAADDVIRHTLMLPAQAVAQIEQVLRDHIARKTPLKAEQALFGYTIVPAAPGRVEVHYLVLPRERLERLLQRLHLEWRELAAIIGPTQTDRPAVSIRLRASERPTSGMGRRLAAAIATVSLALTVLGAVTIAWRQETFIQEMEARARASAPSAQRLAEQLRDVEGVKTRIAELAAARNAPGVVAVWEELARVLPTTAYLVDFEFKGESLHITGFSDSTTDLIPRLEQSPILSEVRLSGPIVTDRATGKEQFSMHARLRRARLPLE